MNTQVASKRTKDPHPFVTLTFHKSTDEEMAARATGLNATLLNHVPENMRHDLPETVAEWRSLAILGTRNCLRRIRLNYPDDVLMENAFTDVLVDLIQAIDGIVVSKSTISVELRQYQDLGLIIPDYRVFAGTADNPLAMSSELTFDFSTEGILNSIKFEGVGVWYYRERGLLCENPRSIRVGSTAYRDSSPLFHFSQVLQFMEIRRAAHTSVNLLTINPTQYKAIRALALPTLKKHLEAVGVPRFCKNPTCSNPLDNSRHYYCNDRCRTAGIKARQRKRTNFT